MTSDRSFSRRNLLTGSGLAAAALANAQQNRAANRPVLAYVGTYSSPQGPEGSRGRGEGIYLFEMDPSNGNLTQREMFPNGSNPSCLAFDPSKTHLYSANETQTYQGANAGSVSAYSIDRSTARLTLQNTVSSRGAGPCHLSVHPTAKSVFVANYHGGTIAVLPIRPDGSLGEATDVKEDRGQVGPSRATSAPPGSFAWSGHDRTHAHMILPDPTGRFIISTDLGMDRIFIWQFDAEKGALAPNEPAYVSVPPGDGPRHFAFHPNGRWMYSIQEEASTLIRFDYEAGRRNATLTARETVSSLPPGYKGTDFTSEVMVSADGKFLYGANRLHDSIAVFSIGQNGALTFVGEEWTRGDYPRTFNFDPTGNFLYSCNQRADHIAIFRVNRKTGLPAFTGQYTAVGTPSSIVFLT